MGDKEDTVNNDLLPDQVRREDIIYENPEDMPQRNSYKSRLVGGELAKKSKWFNNPEYETVNQLQHISNRLDDIFYLLKEHLEKNP